MRKQNEQWQCVKKTPSFEFYVSDRGNCKRIRLRDNDVKVYKGGLNKSIGYRMFTDQYVHRLVATAFLPNPDNLEQVDHINSNRLDNRVENLRWISRKENNSRPHAKKLQSQNHRALSHKHQVLMAQKNGQVRFFKSGFQAARDLGCSRPLIYNALNKRGSARKAYGWDLEWISRSDPRAKEFVQQLEQERLAKASCRRKNFEEMCEHRRAKAVLKQEQKRKTAEIQLQRIEEKHEHKRRKKLMIKIANLDSRIELWKKHLEDVKAENTARIQKLERKIQALEEEKQKLQKMLGDNA